MQHAVAAQLDRRAAVRVGKRLELGIPNRRGRADTVHEHEGLSTLARHPRAGRRAIGSANAHRIDHDVCNRFAFTNASISSKGLALSTSSFVKPARRACPTASSAFTSSRVRWASLSVENVTPNVFALRTKGAGRSKRIA